VVTQYYGHKSDNIVIGEWAPEYSSVRCYMYMHMIAQPETKHFFSVVWSTKGVINNGHCRKQCNIGYTRRRKQCKAQHNMCWTPLCANNMLSAVSHPTKWDVLIAATTGITCMSGYSVVSMLPILYTVRSTHSITLLRRNMDVYGHDILYIITFRSNLI
jgi:hypothetical protein